jgi:hypothetical protein
MDVGKYECGENASRIYGWTDTNNEITGLCPNVNQLSEINILMCKIVVPTSIIEKFFWLLLTTLWVFKVGWLAYLARITKIGKHNFIRIRICPVPYPYFLQYSYHICIFISKKIQIFTISILDVSMTILRKCYIGNAPRKNTGGRQTGVTLVSLCSLYMQYKKISELRVELS